MFFWIVMALPVALFVAGLWSMMMICGRESEQEERRKPFAPATGLACRICGVLESVHRLVTGHQWSL